MKTPKEIAAVFGCTEARARELLQVNGKQLAGMAQKAASTGKKVNGYTQQQLEKHAADFGHAAKA